MCQRGDSGNYPVVSINTREEKEQVMTGSIKKYLGKNNLMSKKQCEFVQKDCGTQTNWKVQVQVLGPKEPKSGNFVLQQ